MPDIYFGSLEQGDILLIASDGLTGMLEDEHLVRILSSDGGPQHWVDRMITEANRRGGSTTSRRSWSGSNRWTATRARRRPYQRPPAGRSRLDRLREAIDYSDSSS